ncbi:uncharacterized protein LOC110988361 isoform X4 [Acanthaster planci]|uniref:Uncharacterized protein LOC110988361 isoform X4 n=1 Tax=Acanthaster planci TaxID=133434 RepID=A0A8B7ZPG6_ACAPL|nr:uncharacterized protein LOC110988361 isoform X4 [Acanthaster planci]
MPSKQRMRSEREEDDGARSGRCVDSITGQSRIRCRRKSSSNEDLDDSDPDSDEEQEQWMEKPEDLGGPCCQVNALQWLSALMQPNASRVVELVD